MRIVFSAFDNVCDANTIGRSVLFGKLCASLTPTPYSHASHDKTSCLFSSKCASVPLELSLENNSLTICESLVVHSQLTLFCKKRCKGVHLPCSPGMKRA